MLDRFLESHQIPVSALEKIRRRIWLVGRFHEPTHGQAAPDVYLFTNRTDLSEEYLSNFTEKGDLTFNDFLRLVKPQVAEAAYQGKYVTGVVQKLPDGNKGERTTTIDSFSYFFLRAVSSSEQPAFKKRGPALASRLTQPEESGASVISQVRTDLGTYCSFQERSWELVEEFAKLLQKCTGPGKIPMDYGYSSPLPTGLPEVLLQFLFAEKPTVAPNVKDIMLTDSTWNSLNNDDGRKLIQNLMSVYRQFLWTGRVEGVGELIFPEGRISDLLATLEKEMAPREPSLAHEYRKALDSLNTLRQILRSRLLLSMVLQWALTSLYEMEGVKSQTTSTGQDRAVLKAVMKDWKAEGLAHPVPRPSTEEQKRFRQELISGFEGVLEAILAKDSDTSSPGKLAAPLRDLVREIKSDPEQVRALRSMAGAFSEDSKLHKNAFVEANRTLIADVLCQILFQVPVLSLRQLQRRYTADVMSTYLMAVLLSPQNEEAIRSVAEDYLEEFQSRIDEKTKRINGSIEASAKVLTEYLKVLCSPSVKAQINESLQAIGQVTRLLTKSGEEGGDTIILPNPGEAAHAVQHTAKQMEKIMRASVRGRLAAAQGKVQSPSKESHVDTSSTAPTDLNSKNAVHARSQIVKPDEQAASFDIDEESIPGFDLSAAIEELTLKHPAGQSALANKKKLTDAETELILADVKKAGVPERLQTELQAFEQALHLIYQRYNENGEKKRFRNQVERMTLAQMMLSMQNDIGLGKTSSNLYQLLLDLIMSLDPEKPDARAFFGEHSLTAYFDQELFEAPDGKGMTELRTILERQVQQSQTNITKIYSEIRGVGYLFDRLGKDSYAEVIFVNSTGNELLTWIETENLDGVSPHARLRTNQLMDAKRYGSESLAVPGLVFLTEMAFEQEGGKGKADFLQRLKTLRVQQGAFRVVPPPMVLSTAPVTARNWDVEGRSLAEMAGQALAPVLIIGPSALINSARDRFSTTLSAGYIFCAHFLSPGDPQVHVANVGASSDGRFRVLGPAGAPISNSIAATLWPQGNDERYSFSADYYLYLMALIWVSALSRLTPDGTVNLASYMRDFQFDDMKKSNHESTRVLDTAFPGGQIRRLALPVQLPDDGHSIPVLMTLDGKPVREDSITAQITDTAWFRNLMHAMGSSI